MPLIGNPYVIGDTTGNFKILDDISSYTLTFNPTSEMNLGDDTITVNDHRFITGQRVVYSNGGGSDIGGLTDSNAYYIINDGLDTIKLALTYSDALVGNAIDLSSVGSGLNHILTLGFDGVNTKFRATFNNGIKGKINSATQLLVTINGVLQKPHLSSTPPDGYGIEHPSVIVFSTAPVISDVFWGNIIANSFPTYDITDHHIDNFTGTGSATDFTLSKIPPNSQSILVTLDGVVKNPTDPTATRDYEVIGPVLYFTTPPGNGVSIQVRHLGFVGAVSSNVTGFYGRTGNVGLTTSDNIEVLTAKIGAGTTFTEDLVVEGDARITGILTVGTGTITLDGDNNTVNVGAALTLSNTDGVLVGSSRLHTTGLEVLDINASGNTSIVGITTLASAGGITTTGGDLYVGGNLSVGGTITASEFRNVDGSEVSGSIGIQSAGILVGAAVTTLNFIGAGNTFSYNESTRTIDISISGGGGGAVSISSEAPPDPNNGDLWYSTIYGRTFVYYDEVELGIGAGAAWVDSAPFNMPPQDGRTLTIGRRTGAKILSIVGVGLSIYTRTGVGTASF